MSDKKLTKLLGVVFILASLSCAKNERPINLQVKNIYTPPKQSSLPIQQLISKKEVLTSSSSNSQKVPNSQNQTRNSISTKDFNIVLKNNAFGKIILLSTSIIEGAPAPSGNAFANKLIYFKRQKQKVYMFESLVGQLATNSIITQKLLAEFKIVESDQFGVTIDFKNGMNSLFVNSAMSASESPSAGDSKDSSLPVVSSFIKKVETRGKYLYINEIARVFSKGETDSIEIKYVLSMYQINKNFKSTASNEQKRVGYFEVKPILQAGTGEKTINIMKFDLNKTIHYYISNNVPKEYLKPVIDGVLYWNTVFGKEVIKVSMLPKDRDVHEPGLNVVRWLHWDSAGFAYANIQADPLTGESLQSEIFMTSVFGLGGLKRAKLYLQRLNATEKKSSTSKVGLKGFSSARFCHFDHKKSHQDLKDIINQIEQSEKPDSEKQKMFQRLSQDYVRSVVAHEIGHTMGLRHNFAGSLSTGLNYNNFRQEFKKYLTTGKLSKDLYPTSTVMDYTPTSIASMNGAFIRLKIGALPYDKGAIAWGYKLADIDLENLPPFCTDLHKGKKLYADCKVWDYLNDPIEGNLYSWEQSIKNVGIDLASLFAKLDKIPDEISVPILGELPVDSDSKAKSIISNLFSELLDSLQADASFISIKTKYPENLDYYNQKQYRRDVKAYQIEATQKHQGLSSLLFSKLKIINGKTNARIEAEKYFNLTLKLEDANFSPIVASLIQSYSEKYFSLFEKELLLQASSQLSGLSLNIKDDHFIDDLTSLVDHVSFDKTKQILIANDKVNIYTPKFDYISNDQNLRSSVSNLLTVDFYKKSPSYKRNLQPKIDVLKTKFSTYKDSVILSSGSRSTLSDDLFDWIEHEDLVLNSLL